MTIEIIDFLWYLRRRGEEAKCRVEVLLRGLTCKQVDGCFWKHPCHDSASGACAAGHKAWVLDALQERRPVLLHLVQGRVVVAQALRAMKFANQPLVNHLIIISCLRDCKRLRYTIPQCFPGPCTCINTRLHGIAELKSISYQIKKHDML